MILKNTYSRSLTASFVFDQINNHFRKFFIQEVSQPFFDQMVDANIKNAYFDRSKKKGMRILK